MLIDNCVDIWLLNTDHFLSNLENLSFYLSLDELEKVSKFKQKIHGDRYLICRSNLRKILSTYLYTKPEKIKISYTKKGKPYISQNKNNPTIHFNLSHTNNQIIYAISKNIVGIDIENIHKQTNYEQLAKRFFCASEYETINQAKQEEKAKIFYSFWTGKEAYLKAIGEGISGGLNTIEFNYQTLNNQLAIVTPSLSQNWQVKSITINNKYLANILVNITTNIHFRYYSHSNPKPFARTLNQIPQ